MLQDRIYADLQAAWEAGAIPGCYWLSADELATLEAEGLTKFAVVEMEAFNAPKTGPNPKIIITDFGQVPLIVRSPRPVERRATIAFSNDVTIAKLTAEAQFQVKDMIAKINFDVANSSSLFAEYDRLTIATKLTSSKEKR